MGNKKPTQPAERGLSELMSILYDEFIITYGGDEDLASLAAAATIDDMRRRENAASFSPENLNDESVS